MRIMHVGEYDATAVPTGWFCRRVSAPADSWTLRKRCLCAKDDSDESLGREGEGRRSLVLVRTGSGRQAAEVRERRKAGTEQRKQGSATGIKPDDWGYPGRTYDAEVS